MISLIFDFELMGISLMVGHMGISLISNIVYSLISWGLIFLGREPILINSVFLKPFELMDLYLRLVNI